MGRSSSRVYAAAPVSGRSDNWVTVKAWNGPAFSRRARRAEYGVSARTPPSSLVSLLFSSFFPLFSLSLFFFSPLLSAFLVRSSLPFFLFFFSFFLFFVTSIEVTRPRSAVPYTMSAGSDSVLTGVSGDHVRVKDGVASGASHLLAGIVSDTSRPVPAAGVPLRVAVPLPLSTKTHAVGSETVAAGFVVDQKKNLGVPVCRHR